MGETVKTELANALNLHHSLDLAVAHWAASGDGRERRWPSRTPYAELLRHIDEEASLRNGDVGRNVRCLAGIAAAVTTFDPAVNTIMDLLAWSWARVKCSGLERAS